MMAGNPNWWNMHPPSLFPPQYSLGSSSLPFNPLLPENQEQLPQSWSQLLLGGLSASDEDSFRLNHFQAKKLENWEDHILNQSPRVPIITDVIKQEVSQNSNLYGLGDHEEFQAPLTPRPPPAWSQQIMPISSSRSCVTSITTGGAYKKARVQPSSTSSQPPLKVRKEKLGDRITALHQLVSPFGKTDTASVLLEAIGYIRFLQGQIEALSSPYLGNASKNMRNQQSDTRDKPKDLRSRGLCLVPLSCTQHVGSDNGADFWAPAYGGGF
uniref:BHLH domain-containing protein n=1 Tax=Fagus sylvatica TaxID=28930 RepID=A0A2N9FBA3_FAGSY